MNYFIITDAEGNGVGGGYTSSKLGSNQYACTQEQSLAPESYSVSSDGTLIDASAANLLTTARNLQAKSLKASYESSLTSVPVTVNGKSYTLAMDQANATLNLSSALSAQQALQSPAWVADAYVALGQLCTVSGVPLFCSTAGKTGSTAPTVPSAIGTPATDGTAEWELFARSAELTDGSYAWFTASETVSVGQQAELYLHTQKKTLIGLLAEVQATKTVADVQSVVWP